jgi:uncharacterized protein YrrD
MNAREFKDLIDLPVVSNADAKDIGHVHQVLFNPRASALFGLVISPTEKERPLLLLPLEGIHTTGKDAVTITSLDVTEPFERNAEAQEISAAGGYLSGMNVMTESGETVGKVDKVTINEDGTVAAYHSTTGLFGSKHDIEPSEVVAGSKDILIISDSARDGAAKNVIG